MFWFIVIGSSFVIGLVVLVLVLSGKADEMVNILDEPEVTKKFYEAFGEPNETHHPELNKRKAK